MQLPQIGAVIGGKYRIEAVLGEGGFGCVYRGVAEHSQRPVAIKVLKPAGDGYPLGRAQRFMREMRAVAKLQSPYTLTLFDCGQTDDGLLFMVTEFIDGVDLNHRLATDGRLTERETVHVVMQILLSLAEAHEAGVLHRDIKPSNIRLFEYDGDPLRAKLLDFGLARSLDDDETRLTGTGNVIGTPRYMSPEQISGGDLTAASDLYSLGLVARECVLGRGDVASASSREVGDTDPVSPAFREAVNAMLELVPDDRPANAHEAYEAFRARLSELDGMSVERGSTSRTTEEESASTTLVEVEHKPEDRPNLWPVLVGLGLVVIAAGLLVRPEPPPAPTRSSDTRVSNPLVTPEPTEEASPETTGSNVQRQAKPRGCADFDGETGYVELELPSDALSVPETIQLHIPKNYNPSRRHPVLVAFRDFRSSSRAVMRRSRLPRLSNDHNLIVVAPKDAGNLSGVWETRDDMEFAKFALEEVKRRYCVDDSRIFAFGHGMGGRAIELVRCELPGVVATATTAFRKEESPKVPCKSGEHLPHISFDPQKNPRAPVEGGTGCGITNAVLSSDAHEEALRAERGCSTKSTDWYTHENGTCRRWACDEGPLVTCRVDGGREFHGTAPRAGLDTKCDGTPVKFPYTNKIWAFFRQVEAGR